MFQNRKELHPVLLWTEVSEMLGKSSYSLTDKFWEKQKKYKPSLHLDEKRQEMFSCYGAEKRIEMESLRPYSLFFELKYSITKAKHLIVYMILFLSKLAPQKVVNNVNIENHQHILISSKDIRVLSFKTVWLCSPVIFHFRDFFPEP